MSITVNSSRWVVRPSKSRLRRRIAQWLLARDHARQLEIALAERDLHEASKAIAAGAPNAAELSYAATRRLLNA